MAHCCLHMETTGEVQGLECALAVSLTLQINILDAKFLIYKTMGMSKGVFHIYGILNVVTFKLS